MALHLRVRTRDDLGDRGTSIREHTVVRLSGWQTSMTDPRAGRKRPKERREHGRDLTGLVFGRLTVIGFVGHRKTVRLWLCRCECGVNTTTTTQRLDEGKTSSCGCLKREKWLSTVNAKKANTLDLTGKRFGRLLVESFSRAVVESEGNSFRTSLIWCCICDCGRGKKVYLTTKSLRRGDTQSCGCLTFGKPGRLAANNLLIKQYKKGAASRGLEWSLTDEDFLALTQQTCHYCGIPPASARTMRRRDAFAFVYNGVDRVNNDVGYTLENSVPCCSVCNFAKGATPYGEFISWVDRLIKHRLKKVESNASEFGPS